MDYKEYVKSGEDKGKKKDQLLDKSNRKAATYYVVKQALVDYGDSSREFGKSDTLKMPLC